MSRSTDRDNATGNINAAIRGEDPKCRVVQEDIPGVGPRPVFEGGTFARDNLAGLIEASTDPKMMRTILVDGFGVKGVTEGNALATWRAVSPEGFIFRRKTGSGTSYFTVTALETLKAAPESLAGMFAPPKAATKKATK